MGRLLALLWVACAAVVVSMPVNTGEEVLLEEAKTHASPAHHVAHAVHAVHSGKGHHASPAHHVAHAVHAAWGTHKKAGTSLPGKLPQAGKVGKPRVTGHHVHHVAMAVHEVWKNHKGWGPHKGAHWHCVRCHSKCKTRKCKMWCHKQFCGPKYNGGIPTGKHAIGQLDYDYDEDIPTYVNAARHANKLLDKSVKAKKMRVLKKTSRSIDKVKNERERDIKHWQRVVGRADALNKAAYTSDKKRRKKLSLLKKEVRKERMDVRETDVAHSNARTAKNNAYIAGIKAQRDAEEAMHGGMVNWMNSLANIHTHVDTSTSKEPTTTAEAVSAKLAKIAVHVKAIKDHAEKHARKAKGHAHAAAKAKSATKKAANTLRQKHH